MIYQEIEPSPTLKRFVKCYWVLETQNEDSVILSKEKVLPDGCMEIIFHYGSHFKKYDPLDHGITQPLAFLHGQIKNFIELESTGPIGVFGIRFYPAALYELLGQPMQEYLDSNVSIEDVFGSYGKDLHAQIHSATNSTTRVHLAEQFLIRMAINCRPMDPVVKYALVEIHGSRGNHFVHEICTKLDVSERQLERKFATNIGLSPKQYSRIVRLSHLVRQLEKGSPDTFTTYTYQMGYFDQSHLIKDFKKFTGIIPSAYTNSINDIADHFIN